ncbi:sigma-70 family RNA polymerase sigma factor [Alkalihalobacillus sp. R86527]|uniref:sigma-70 family RNA polymerase sigma factor n=1 Tax=Alkalihalobacillus sp. R86527 TaxID=3093863 RepID=UPI00366FC872
MEEIDYELFEATDSEWIIDEVMKKYGQEVLQLVYSYVKNKTVAEDLTQEIFIKCYKSLHKYNGKSKLRTWLWRIAINHCKDYLKSWYNNNVSVSDGVMEVEAAPKESVEKMIIQRDEDQQLVSEVMNLPLKYREVIYLRYFEELQIKEIKQVTGVNSSTVKTRLKRAKLMLKERLED